MELSLQHIYIVEAGSTCLESLLTSYYVEKQWVNMLLEQDKLKIADRFPFEVSNSILVVWQWLPKYHVKKVIKASASSDCLDLDLGHEAN